MDAELLSQPPVEVLCPLVPGLEHRQGLGEGALRIPIDVERFKDELLV